MAPKPFNPPRPQASRGRPKGSTVSNGAKRKSTGTSKATPVGGSGVEKARKNKKSDKGKEIEKERLSTRSFLRSLSPNSASTSPPREELDDASDDPFSSQPLRSRNQPNRNLSPSPVEDDRRENIPEDLLNVLIHQFFKQEGTRMSKDANKAVGRYMETFVREALARAAWARDEGGGGVGGLDLEVEDLEKLAPQLVLDF